MRLDGLKDLKDLKDPKDFKDLIMPYSEGAPYSRCAFLIIWNRAILAPQVR